MNQETINLSGFTGTENYYKASLFSNLKVTDGVHYLRNIGECYWLIDIIASYQGKLGDASFQVWTLKVKNNKGVVICEDGNKNVLRKQVIKYTDFEEKTGLKEIQLYCTGGVILLPGEY